jgi:hypothetical protein
MILPPLRPAPTFLAATLAFWSAAAADLSAAAPTNDPAAHLKLPWTGKLKWDTVVDASALPGDTADAKFAAAQEAVLAKGGGVVYFPAGTYAFTKDIVLKGGVILRGADPVGVTDAKQDGYDPPTKFEFPKYVPKFEGTGTPIDTAFMGIKVSDPAADSDCGVVNVSINRGHIHFADAPVRDKDGDKLTDAKAGRNRIVFGCVLRNAAQADPAVPDAKIGQHPWQRHTYRFGSAVEVRVSENALVANNRMPKSGDDDFTHPEYVLPGKKKGETETLRNKVVFDYDNRPGIAVNDYGIGGQGGQGPDGTPETHPWGFRKGLVIRDNFIYCSGRCAITFTGDGVYCGFNVIRFPEGVVRYTTTGRNGVAGSGTNDNRAVQMRGWRWTVEGNDYVVHRNRAGDTGYLINDGEGLMHEDHVNATVKDSKLINNKGNTYISIYKTAGIDGLVMQGNDIRLGDGKQTIASGAAIYVVADRNSGRYECRNVSIVGNTTAGGGILIAGSPAENNVVKDNRHIGDTPAPLRNFAAAKLENNANYEVLDKEPDPKPRKPAPKPKAEAKPEAKPESKPEAKPDKK